MRLRYGQICCNGCGTYGPLYRAMPRDPGAAAARRALRKAGWRRVPGRPGKDYCSRCVPKLPFNPLAAKEN